MRKGGTISVVGAYGPLYSNVKIGDAMNKGLTIRANQTPVKRQWPRLLEHLKNGYFKRRMQAGGIHCTKKSGRPASYNN